MRGESRTIARALRFASHNVLDKGDITFLEVYGRRLVAKVYDGDERKDQRMVTVGLRNCSTADYSSRQAEYSSDETRI
ncbi:hypothetical protein FPOAC2_14172 [Fusarium poae]|jgi:hypothetical protein